MDHLQQKRVNVFDVIPQVSLIILQATAINDYMWTVWNGYTDSMGNG